MSFRFSLFLLALSVGACSQGSTSQSSPPQPGQPQSQPQAPAPGPAAQKPAQPESAPPAALPAAKPESVPPAAATPPAEKPAKPETPGAAAESGKGGASSSPPAQSAGSPQQAAAESAQPAKPQFREITLPVGTALSVRLSTPVGSDTSQLEDQVRGTLTQAIVRGGWTAVPAGTEVTGTVRDAKRSGRVKGLASIAFQFERLLVRDESLPIRTATVSRQAAANRKDDVKKGAIGGAAGAIVGGIVGGGTGAAIGAGVGGAGAVVGTRGEEVRLETGTTVRTTLQQPLKIVVPLKNES
jgi:hypothetical protein